MYHALFWVYFVGRFFLPRKSQSVEADYFLYAIASGLPGGKVGICDYVMRYNWLIRTNLSINVAITKRVLCKFQFLDIQLEHF